MINPKYNTLAVGTIFVALLLAMGYLSYKLVTLQGEVKYEIQFKCEQPKNYT
jgi:hypothetical protein